MPNPFPTMRLRQLIKILRRLGYEVERQEFSHHWLVAPDRPSLCLAFHSTREISSHEVRDVLVRQLVGHEENVRELDGAEVVLRCATDEHYRSRTIIADRVIAALRDSSQRPDLLSYPSDKVGEIVFIAVLATDTLGWIASQLDDSGEPAVIAAPVGEGLIWTNVVSYGDADGSKMQQPSETAAELPNGSHTTVGQMMLDAPLLRPTGRSLVHP